MTTLPAGPASSPVVQLLYWVYRPIPFMEDCARRFGDVFTVRFPANPPMQPRPLDVISRTVSGVAEGPTFTRLRARLTRLLAMPGSRFAPLVLLPFLQVDLGLFSPWGWLVRIARDVDEILFTEIRRRRAEGGGRDDVLSMLVEARYEDGAAMTDQELRDEMLTLLLAGHETT